MVPAAGPWQASQPASTAAASPADQVSPAAASLLVQHASSYSCPAGMPTEPPFLRLCSQADVASLVLQKLPPKALACLGSSCAALRTLVDSQPEALWQAAAGLSGYSGTHPVRRAPCVRAYLRQQHRVHGNLASACFREHHLQLRHGAVSPNCRKHATLTLNDHGAIVVHIRQLPSQAVLHRWPLPFGKQYCRDQYQWPGFDPTSRLLAVPHGGAWWTDAWVPNNTAGVVLLDTTTGHVVHVQLPSQAERMAMKEPASLRGWSSSSLLLIRHDNAAAEDSFSVFDPQGVLVDAFCPPLGSYLKLVRDCNCWAPDGGLAIIQFCFVAAFWLWDVQAASKRQFNLAADIRPLAWAPASDAILFSSKEATTVFNIPQHRFIPQLSPAASLADWGEHGLACQESSPVAGSVPLRYRTCLCVYQVSSQQQLVLTHSLDVFRAAWPTGFLAPVAPDGVHCLLSFALPDSDRSLAESWRLLALNTISGHVQQLQVDVRRSHGVRWGSNGCQILLNVWETGELLLLDLT